MRRIGRPNYNKLKDEDLIDLYLNKGDEVALNQLLSRYLDKVYYYAKNFLKKMTPDLWNFHSLTLLIAKATNWNNS